MSKFKVGDVVRVKAGSPKKLWRHGFTWDASHSFGEKLIVEECYSNDKFENRVHLVGDHGVIENCYLEPWNDSEEWDGEKWVAVKTADRWFKVNASGKVYKATLVSPNGDCVLDFKGILGFFCKNDVEEVRNYNPDDCKPKHAIVILREDGILKPSSNPTVHESTSKAKAEAKRLAEKHKGQEFVVFQEVDRKKVEKLAKSPVVCGVCGEEVFVIGNYRSTEKLLVRLSFQND